MDLSLILSPAVDGESSRGDEDQEWEQHQHQQEQDDADARWNVHDMRHAVDAVDILSDFHHRRARDRHAPPHDPGREPAARERQRERERERPRASTDYAFSGLDLLFQADAMIQLRDGPTTSASPSASPATSPTTSRATSKSKSASTSTSASALVAARAKETDLSLRSGVWSKEEEEYAAALITHFLHGALDVPEGTTLRKFLADQLGCNRRRVSMKLATETIAGMKLPRKVGASVFVAQKPRPSAREAHEISAMLEALRRKCFNQYEASRLAIADEDMDGPDAVAHRTSSPSRSSRRGEVDSPMHLPSETPSRGHRHSHSHNHGHTKRGKASSTMVSSSSPDSVAPRRTKRSPSQALKRRRPLIIRTGFDSTEEEEYVTAMVEYFLEGTLDLPNDTRLVAYLCEQLECSAMKLSMKLAPLKADEHKFPDNIGSAVFARKPDGSPSSNSSEVFEAEAHIYELRQQWQEACATAAADQPESEEEELMSPISTPLRKAKVETTSTPRTKVPPQTARPYTRSGPWSKEEEAYAAALIDAFFRGVLDIAEGTTLRAFLTSRLGCNPMRISKKLASENIGTIRIPKKLGSATYVRHAEVSDEERKSCEEQLSALELLQLDKADPKDTLTGAKHPRSNQILLKSPPQVPSEGDRSAARNPFKMRRIQLGRRSRIANASEESSWAYRYQQVAYGA